MVLEGLFILLLLLQSSSSSPLSLRTTSLMRYRLLLVHGGSTETLNSGPHIALWGPPVERLLACGPAFFEISAGYSHGL